MSESQSHLHPQESFDFGKPLGYRNTHSTEIVEFKPKNIPFYKRWYNSITDQVYNLYSGARYYYYYYIIRN